MFYTSTRDKSIKVTASQAIAQGISEEEVFSFLANYLGFLWKNQFNGFYVLY